VPSCPGWSVSDLVGHVATLYRWVATIVGDGLTQRLDHAAIEAMPTGGDPIEWLDQGRAALSTTLQAVGVEREVWTLGGIGRSGFWFRRIAQETLVHRFDVELAYGEPSASDPLLAADGVDEFWSLQLARKLPQRPIAGLQGELSVVAIDADSTWTLALRPDSVTILEPDAPRDVTVRGPADELLRFFWNRTPLRHSSVEGQRSLIDRWHELVRL
jgi:uncharacterized protein (TIGR03083 family)